MSAHPDEHDQPAGAVPETWDYGGIRVLDGKRVHAWIDPSGRELLYAHQRGRTTWAVGSFYTAEVSRPDGTTRLHNEPTYTGEQADDDLRRHLWAADTADRARLARLAQERNDARRKRHRRGPGAGPGGCANPEERPGPGRVHRLRPAANAQRLVHAARPT